MDFIEIFKANWQGIFIVLGPSLGLGKIVELGCGNINKLKKWSDMCEALAGYIVSIIVGFILLYGLKMPLEAVLIVVSFGMLSNTGYINATSYLKNGAKKKAKE